MSPDEKPDTTDAGAAEEKASAKKPAAKKPAVKKAAAAGKPAAEKKPTAAKKPAEQAKKPAKRAPAAKQAEPRESASEGAGAIEAAEKKPARRTKPAAKPRAAAAEERKREAEQEQAQEAEAEKPAPLARASAKAQTPIGQRRAVVRAQARYVRTSARKARMVCGHLRGKSVVEARAILAFTSREVARDWSKLLESAVANAENNHELLEEDLLVREAFADEGPTIKRFRPRAQGRATPIRKRTSHLTITLTPRA
jgi:large subunit ribosomal protein L22